MTDKESRIAERMRIRGSAKLQPKTPVPKTIAKPSRSQPTRTGLSEKIPSRYCALPGFFVSRNGSVGPSQSPTTAFTQSQTGARDRTEGSFMARSRPCHAAWEPCDRLPFAPKKSSAAQTRAKLRSLYPISAVSEPSSGIVCGNGLECFGDGLIQSFLAASFGGTEELFELRPSLLDGVQVGRVGR